MKLSVQHLATLAVLVAPAGCCLQATTETTNDGGVVDAGDAGAADAGFGHLPECLVVSPASVDFGNVDVNTTATLMLSATNTCGIELPITIGTIRGNDPLLFATVPSSGAAIRVPDEKTMTLTIQYVPLVPSQKQNQAYLTIEFCGGSAPCVLTVQLTGTAVSSCLNVAPAMLDFGFTQPATSVAKFVTLANICSQTPVHLWADPAVLNTDSYGRNSPAGPLQPGAGFPTKDTVIPPGQSVQVPVIFTPLMLGKFIGELDVSTDDATNANVVIPLTGFGGGAAISCAPTALDFGLDAVGISATLPIVCTNVGSDLPGHPEANLFIPDPNSSDQGLALENGDYAFAAQFHNPFPTSGLAAGESTRLDVTYRPLAAGDNADTLLVSSNGANGSLTRIPLSGSAKNLPPCDFQIELPDIPPIDFGHVAEGTTAVASFDIVNTGVDACVVNAFQVTNPGRPPVFSLPDFAEGSSSSRTIPGSSRLAVHVQFDPNNQGLFAGTVSFTISNPNSPQVLVDVEGTSP